MKLMLDAANRSSNSTKALGVDPKVQPQFLEICEQYGDQITHIPSDSAEAFDKVREELSGEYLSLLFIDGDHTYDWVCHDLQKYAPLVAAGGLLIVHDYFDDQSVDTTEELFARAGPRGWGVGTGCRQLIENRDQWSMIELPLLYPDSLEQSRSEIPPVSRGSSTLRCFRRNEER